MTKLEIAMTMIVLVCGCGDTTGAGGSTGGNGEGGGGAPANGGGGQSVADTVEAACIASCDAYNECHPDGADCNSGCTGIGQVTEAAGGTCSDDVLTVFDCVSGAADCDAVDGCGLELGFGCIDQYCEANPEEPGCG